MTMASVTGSGTAGLLSAGSVASAARGHDSAPERRRGAAATHRVPRAVVSKSIKAPAIASGREVADVAGGRTVHLARDRRVEHDRRDAGAIASSGVRPNPSYSDRKANTDARAYSSLQRLPRT